MVRCGGGGFGAGRNRPHVIHTREAREIRRYLLYNRMGMVEAAGVEPASENPSPQDPTCVSPFSCRGRLETEPSAPAAIPDASRPHASGRHVRTSPLDDGHSRGTGLLGATAHCLSSESVVCVRRYVWFHRINEGVALGTRPTVPNPRRSQIAPTRCDTVNDRTFQSTLHRRRGQSPASLTPSSRPSADTPR